MPEAKNFTGVGTPRFVEEQAFCYKGRLAGMSYADIASAATAYFGYPMSRQTAWNRVNHELAERIELAEGDKAKLRQMMLDELDAQTRRLGKLVGETIPVFTEGGEMATVFNTPERRLAAENVLLRNIQRRADLLGLDQPTQSEVTLRSEDAPAPAIVSMLNELRAQQGAPAVPAPATDQEEATA